MHERSENPLEGQFAEGKLDLESYWDQVAQPRFMGLAEPLSDKDVIRLQKGLKRVAQAHHSAMQFGELQKITLKQPLTDADLSQAHHAMQCQLGLVDEA